MNEERSDPSTQEAAKGPSEEGPRNDGCYLVDPCGCAVAPGCRAPSLVVCR